MAIFSLTDAAIYFGGADLTGDSNRLELGAGVEEKDATTFGTNGWRSRAAGLKTADFSGGGFLQLGTGSVEETLFTNLASTSVAAMSVAATSTDGDVAYTFQPLLTSLRHVAQIGELAQWEGNIAGRDRYGLVRGRILHPDSTARTATGSGTARQLGAVGVDQHLYASLHVLSVSGTDTPTLTVKVQSDDNSGMTSATDRITFSAASATGSQWATRVAGAITDDWWRVTWTISGTNPSFLFVAVVGIQ